MKQLMRFVVLIAGALIVLTAHAQEKINLSIGTGGTGGVYYPLETVPVMNKKYGNLYVADVIPRTTYPGMAQDNKQATVWNILLAHEKMSNDVAYSIVKTIFEKRDELIAVHREASNIKLGKPEGRRKPDPVSSGRGQVPDRKGRQTQLR